MPPRKRRQPRGVVTPLKSFRPYPPELWDDAKVIADELEESVTDVLNRALVDYVQKHRHILKESRPAPPDTKEPR